MAFRIVLDSATVASSFFWSAVIFAYRHRFVEPGASTRDATVPCQISGGERSQTTSHHGAATRVASGITANSAEHQRLATVEFVLRGVMTNWCAAEPR
jgi:hypothetical protein